MDLSCFNRKESITLYGGNAYDIIVTTYWYVRNNKENLTKDGNWPDSRRLLQLNVVTASKFQDDKGCLGEKARELLALIEEIEDWYNGR